MGNIARLCVSVCYIICNDTTCTYPKTIYYLWTISFQISLQYLQASLSKYEVMQSISLFLIMYYLVTNDEFDKMVHANFPDSR